MSFGHLHTGTKNYQAVGSDPLKVLVLPLGKANVRIPFQTKAPVAWPDCVMTCNNYVLSPYFSRSDFTQVLRLRSKVHSEGHQYSPRHVNLAFIQCTFSSRILKSPYISESLPH